MLPVDPYFAILDKVSLSNGLPKDGSPKTTSLLRQLNDYWNMIGEMIMAQRGSDNPYHIPFGSTWFAQSNLTADDLLEFDGWFAENYEGLPELVSQSLFDGDKLGWSYDLPNDTLVCSLTIRDKKNTAYGAVITSRSNDPMDCLALCLWKRHVHFNLDELKNAGTMGTRG